MAELRALSETERVALLAILGCDFPGVESLRVQAETVLGRTGCVCGCGTLDLVVPDDTRPAQSTPTVAPAELTIVDDRGDPLGSVRLFVHDGVLSSLEVSSYGDPLPMPDLGRTRLELVPGPARSASEAP